ncbi:MAG TPA: hypothetical protein DCS35_19365 [Vibrio sp.]|nr:hypothetical protein [Vibrio sp.]
MAKFTRYLLVAFLLVCPAISQAESAHSTPQNDKLLVVGFPYKYIEPLAIKNESGQIDGLLPALFKKYANQAGYDVEIQSYETFSDVMAAYVKGDLDVMIGVTATLERESIMTFSEPILAIRRGAVSAQHIGSYEELKNKTVATIKGFADESFLKNILPSARSLSVPSNLEAIRTVALGLADAQIGDGVMLYEHYKNSPYRDQVDMFILDELPVDTLYLGVPKSEKLLLEQLNDAIKVVNEMPEYSRIIHRWLDEKQQEFIRKATSLTLSSEEQRWIDSHPVVDIGVARDWAPIEQVIDGKYQGIAADVLDEISKLTGIQFEYVSDPLHKQTYKAFLQGSFPMMAAISPTDDRLDKMLITQGFMREPWVVLGRSSEYNTVLSGFSLDSDDTVGVVAETYGLSMYKELCSSCTVIKFDSQKNLIEAIMQGSVDAGMSSLLLAQPYMQGQYLGQLKVINSLSDRSFIPVAFAVNKENQTLLNIINKAISVIPPSKLVAIEKRWMQTSYQTGVQTKQVVVWISLILGVSSLVIGLIFYSNRKLQREVEQRREVETALQQKIKFERSLLDAIPFPIIVKDREGKVVAVNRTVHKLAREENSAVEQIDEQALRVSEVGSIIYDSVEEQSVLCGESIEGKEKRIVFSEQDKHFAYWKCPYILDAADTVAGTVTILHNITELRDAEIRAREAEQGIQYLADNVNGAVIQHFQSKENRDDLEFSFVSAGIFDLVGVTPKEMIDDHHIFFDLMDEEQLEDFLVKTRCSAEQGTMSHEIHIHSLDKWIQLQSKITQRNEKFIWNTVLTDITELKAQQKELESAKSSAIAATEAKSRFLANMSHEIRTPIGGIISLLELFTEYSLPPEAVKLHSSLTKSASNLLHIVNDILDFSKIEAGKLEIAPVAASMHSMLLRMAQTQSSHAHSKGLTFEFWLAQDVCDVVIVDEVRLSQIINNFANNAIKFTEKGEVRLAIDSFHVEGSVQTVCFTISDTGIGMDEQCQRNLFEPFVQADESTQRKFGGTGLGLSISKQLVEQMGGKITVTSKLNQGSCFRILIPVEVQEQHKPVELTDEPVLVVGDFNQKSELKRYLSSSKTTIIDRDFNSKVELGCVASEIKIRQIVISDSAYQQLGLSKQWLSRELPEVNTLLVQNAPLFSPEPYDDCWKLSVSPLMPDQLYHCLTNKVSNVEQEIKYPAQPEIITQTRDEALNDNRLVLVAEDHPINRQVIKTMLYQLGYVADIVDDGVQAYEELQKRQYGLLLTDCHMPEMDGYELTKVIRAQECEQNKSPIPIIALTANAIHGEAERCLELGMTEFLTKPVKKEKLRDTLEKWLPPINCSAKSFDDSETDIAIDGLDAIDSFDFDLGFVDQEEIVDSAPVANRHLQSERNDNLVDLEVVLEIFGDEGIAHDMIRQFYESYRNDVDSLISATDSHNHDDVQNIAHRIKGAASTLGSNQIEIVATELERFAQQGIVENYRECTKQLDELSHRLRQEISIRIGY